VLNLWWGLTEQTYLYYWHQKVWAVLACWGILLLLLLLVALIGEELWTIGWRAGYRAAVPAMGTAKEAPGVPLPDSTPNDTTQPGAPEKRRFLAPPSQALPGMGSFLGRRRGQGVSNEAAKGRPRKRGPR
jgi:hypothetical protein